MSIPIFGPNAFSVELPFRRHRSFVKFLPALALCTIKLWAPRIAHSILVQYRRLLQDNANGCLFALLVQCGLQTHWPVLDVAQMKTGMLFLFWVGWHQLLWRCAAQETGYDDSSRFLKFRSRMHTMALESLRNEKNQLDEAIQNVSNTYQVRTNTKCKLWLKSPLCS